MKYITLTMLSLIIQGCSSLSSHFEHEFGHPYSGTESSVSSFGCNISVSATALFVPVPFIIVDVPMSIVMDTVFLPVDLLAQPELNRDEVLFTEKKCLDGMGGVHSSSEDVGTSS